MFRREILTAPFCQIYVNIFSMGDKVGTVYESILPGRFTEQNSQGPDVSQPEKWVRLLAVAHS